MHEHNHEAAPLTFAIITCSDTRGMKQDTAGAALEQLIADNGWECKSHVVVKDEVPQISAAMRAHSLAITPFAMLSRALCMQRGTHLVVNLPGSEKAARENWDGIVAALPHAVKMMAGGGH